MNKLLSLIVFTDNNIPIIERYNVVDMDIWNQKIVKTEIAKMSLWLKDYSINDQMKKINIDNNIIVKDFNFYLKREYPDYYISIATKPDIPSLIIYDILAEIKELQYNNSLISPDILSIYNDFLIRKSLYKIPQIHRVSKSIDETKQIMLDNLKSIHLEHNIEIIPNEIIPNEIIPNDCNLLYSDTKQSDINMQYKRDAYKLLTDPQIVNFGNKVIVGYNSYISKFFKSKKYNPSFKIKLYTNSSDYYDDGQTKLLSPKAIVHVDNLGIIIITQKTYLISWSCGPTSVHYPNVYSSLSNWIQKISGQPLRCLNPSLVYYHKYIHLLV